ncbi:nephrin, partial [Trichonephila inaurata madagascariensis]
VGPAPNNQPIRAHAKVSVIVPPKALEIRNQKNGSTVEMREGQKLTLQCLAKNSKPATQLKWMRNGLEITKDVTPVREEEANPTLKTTSTSITLSPKLDDNGAIYSCIGEHKALSRPIRTNVFLSVLFPPGPPQIEGYHDGDIVQVGDKLNLACISRGGNPAARLIWFRNDEQVDVTYSTGGREATNTHTFTVGPKDNKAVYKCEASNVVTNQPLTASVRLNVLCKSLSCT